MRAMKLVAGAFVAGALVVGGMLVSPASAAGATFTWSGAGGDNLFSNASNWQENAVPTNDAKIVFPCLTASSDSAVALTNDLTGVTIGEISTAEMGQAGCQQYTINTVALSSTAVFSGAGSNTWGLNVKLLAVTGGSNLTVNSGSGVTIDSSAAGTMNVASLTAQDLICGWVSLASIGTIDTLTIGSGIGANVVGINVDSVVVKSGGVLGLASAYANKTFAGDITLEAGSSIGSASSCGGGGSAGAIERYTTTLSGSIALQGDIPYTLSYGTTLKLTGTLSGTGYALKATSDNKGTFVNATSSNTTKTPGGTTSFTPKDETITGKKDNIAVYNKQTITLKDATVNWAIVYKGGTLKGNGSVGYLDALGTIAPGNSPGTITVTNILGLGTTSTYQAEILNKKSYDKIVYKGSNAPMIEDGAKLDVSLLAGATIKKGDTFTIIDNQSKTAFSGTFDGLKEGAEFVMSDAANASFKISYKGGDGNDIVLTALNSVTIPGTPKTGIEILKSQPVAIALGTLVAAISLVAIARKMKSRA